MSHRTSRSVSDHGDWAIPYEPAYIADLDPATANQHIGIPRPPLEAAVHRIVEMEGPIHREVLSRHLGELLYRSGRSQRWEEGTVERLVEEGRLAETDGFLDIPGRPCTHARRPLPGLTKRPVEHVAPAERQRALLGLVEDRPRRLSAEQAVAEAARFFGWSPSTGRAPARLMADLYRLRDTGAVTGWPGKLEPVDGS
ncbi:hypothetical protein C1I97_04515 [Streptomyces sp. NTH33]|uniref:DUF3320 domain-containing protein n=1 Tax=Streptomyces sp. NTH33 TaxID=1735453 RepID=UPI000DA8B274|nr:DUF3320 domain-containing protein [Streptomyces sp. NTH33]PZH17854.1 hypothetical protein C1I97_04515 [Streptomyces sp. NTH33]